MAGSYCVVTAIVRWFCTDCLAGNCGLCVDLGPQLDDGAVCECEHDDLLWHDAAVPGHIREGATPGEFLDPPQPGILLVDCSCGAEYTVPQGDDEYGAIEDAHRAHIAATPPETP